MIDVMAERTAGVQIGARVRAERQRLGWSQQQLAIQAHVDRSWIAGLEAGNTEDPSALRMEAIARAMAVDINYLLTGVRRDAEPLPVKPGYRRILERLQSRYPPDQLSRFERAMAALFLRTERLPTEDANGERQHQGTGDAPDAGLDREDLDAG